MQQQPALTPQQTAIQEVRTRYERGDADMPIDRFEYAITALLQASTPEACRAILQELSIPWPHPPPPPLPARRWMVGLIGELKRLRRPWRMGQRTIALMAIGELELDLSIATLPQHGVLQVYALVGEAKIYVPRDVHVSVRAFALIGEIKALDESREGIFALLHEEDFPAQGPAAAAPHLEIHVLTLVGEVQVEYVDAPVATRVQASGATRPPALPQPQ